MKKILIIVGLVLVSFVLRISFVDWIPWGFHWDEASYAYNAYSILNTGRDEWGIKLPIFLKAYGDYKPAFLSYLMIPFFLFFGVSEFSARLPVVILSCLGILAFFSFLQKVEKKNGAFLGLPLIASFILAVSPWHMHYSRIAFDPILSLSFILIGLNYYIDKSIKKRFFGIFSLLFSMYLYNSARIFVPLLILLIESVFLIKWDKKFTINYLNKNKIFFLIIIIGISLIWSSTLFSTVGARAKKVFFWNWSEANISVEEGIYRSVMSDLPLIRFFHNKLIYVVTEFGSQYFSHFSSEFLLMGNNQSGEFAFSRFGYILLIFTPFILLGIIDKKHDRLWLFFVLWLILSPIPSALSNNAPNGNRALIMIPALTFFSARGLITIINFIKAIKFTIVKNLILLLLFFLIFFNILLYLRNFYLFFPEDSERYWHGFYSQSAVDIYNLRKNYNRVYISDADTQTYIFFSWYNLINPKIIQAQSNNRFIDMRGVSEIDNMVITQIKEKEASCLMKEDDILLVSSEVDGWVLPKEKFQPTKEYFHLSRYHNDKESSLRLYESKNLNQDQVDYLNQTCQE